VAAFADLVRSGKDPPLADLARFTGGFFSMVALRSTAAGSGEAAVISCRLV
jgi:hypothetical protein